jgi:hypothetical protein
MTREDLRLFCTALGFTAVVLQDVENNEQAERATALAHLIEAFCLMAVPEISETALPYSSVAETAAIDLALERYKIELVTKGSGRLPQDRAMLLKFYDRLHQRQQRFRERHFYATGSDDMIANRVLQLVEEEIANDEGEA